MENSLVVSHDLWLALRGHLLRDMNEHLAFVLAGRADRADGSISLLARDLILIDDAELEGDHHQDGIALTLEALVKVMNEAWSRGLILVEAHSHPLSQGSVHFSRTDAVGQRELRQYLLEVYGDQVVYGAIVLGSDCVDGAVWKDGHEAQLIGDVRIVGDHWLKLQTTSVPDSNKKLRGAKRNGSNIHDRQILALGERGQKIIEGIHVGVVGLGGLGSMVVEQLAYLGVRRFTLIDFDVVEQTNLNRLIGANRSDVGRRKVEVASRLLNRITRATEVRIVASHVRHSAALEQLKSADIIFGCVDSDSGRLILNEFALAYMIPYIDTGVGIDVADGVIAAAGGRVVVWTPQRPCLLCANEINVRVAAEELETEEQRMFRREHGYVTGHDLPAPSVVSLNGTIASLAVTEFLSLVTGVRLTNHYTYYDFLEQRVGPRLVRSNPQCVACANYGLGDKANLQRYYLQHDRQGVPAAGASQ